MSEHEMKMKDVIPVVFSVALSSQEPLRVFLAALSVILLLTDTFFHVVWLPNTHHLLHLVLNWRKQPKTPKREE